MELPLPRIASGLFHEVVCVSLYACLTSGLAICVALCDRQAVVLLFVANQVFSDSLHVNCTSTIKHLVSMVDEQGTARWKKNRSVIIAFIFV
jgi:hypothetical protein